MDGSVQMAAPTRLPESSASTDRGKEPVVWVRSVLVWHSRGTASVADIYYYLLLSISGNEQAREKMLSVQGGL